MNVSDNAYGAVALSQWSEMLDAGRKRDRKDKWTLLSVCLLV